MRATKIATNKGYTAIIGVDAHNNKESEKLADYGSTISHLINWKQAK